MPLPLPVTTRGVPRESVSVTVGCTATKLLPFASFNCTVIVDVLVPLATRLLGEATTVVSDGETACATVTEMVVVMLPEVARTVRVPFATAVTSPVATPDVTAVTTVESVSTDQTTVGFEIG